MTKTNKSSQKPFSKPFYKLLAGSVLALALVFGGMVWANWPGIQYCYNNPSLCVGLTPKGTAIETSQQRTEKLSRNNNKRLQITNKLDEAVFVPLKTQVELDSFLNAIQPNSGNSLMAGKFDVCEVGLAKTAPASQRAFTGVEGCDTSVNGVCNVSVCKKPGACTAGTVSGFTTNSTRDLNVITGTYNWTCNGADGGTNQNCSCPNCVITIISGQRCRVKDYVTNWEVVNEKKWHNGAPFDWDGGSLKANPSDPGNFYWRFQDNDFRTRCGTGGRFVGGYAYGPRKNGNEWAKYRCDKSSSWTCFWDGCNYWWTEVESFNQKNATRVYVSTRTNNTNRTVSSYGNKCTETYYSFSGSYAIILLFYRFKSC